MCLLLILLLPVLRCENVVTESVACSQSPTSVPVREDQLWSSQSPQHHDTATGKLSDLEFSIYYVLQKILFFKVLLLTIIGLGSW